MEESTQIQNLPEETFTTPRMALLDLDTIEAPRLPVVLNGTTYQMVSKHDLSMADREELRLIMLHIAELQEPQEAKSGKHQLSKAEREVYTSLEQRLCGLALPDAPESVIKALTPAQRNKLMESFFTTVDLMGIVSSFVATMRQLKQQQREKARVTPPPMTSGPPLPPEQLLGPLPSSNTGKKKRGTPASPVA